MSGKSKEVADALSKNIPVGALSGTDAMTHQHPILTANFSIKDPLSAQREHSLWKMIYPLKSRDESPILELTVPFTHLFLSPDGVLCRYWKQTSTSRTTYSPGQIHCVCSPSESRHAHCGTPGGNTTLFTARKKKNSPTLRKDVETCCSTCNLRTTQGYDERSDVHVTIPF